MKLTPQNVVNSPFTDTSRAAKASFAFWTIATGKIPLRFVLLGLVWMITQGLDGLVVAITWKLNATPATVVQVRCLNPRRPTPWPLPFLPWPATSTPFIFLNPLLVGPLARGWSFNFNTLYTFPWWLCLYLGHPLFQWQIIVRHVKSIALWKKKKKNDHTFWFQTGQNGGSGWPHSGR